MWVLPAVLASFCQASIRVSNQFLRYDGATLTFRIKILSTLYAAPFLFFVAWPDNPWFYVFTLATAPLVVYQDKNFFDFTSRFGAGPVTRVEPLSIPFVFVVWLLVHPTLLFHKLEQPLVFAGICLSVAASVFFAIRMRRCPISRNVIRSMIPLILVAGAINLLCKAGIDYMPQGSGLVVYIFLQSLFVSMISYGMKKQKALSVDISKRKVIIATVLISLLMLSVVVMRLIALRMVDNPAYVTAIMLMGPFWTCLINKALGHREEGELLNGMGVVCSVLLLTILSAM